MHEPLVHPAYDALQSLQPRAYFGFDAKRLLTPRASLRTARPKTFAAERKQAVEKLIASTRFTWMGCYLDAPNQASRYWYGLMRELGGGDGSQRPPLVHPVPLFVGELDYIDCGGLHNPNRWHGRKWWPLSDQLRVSKKPFAGSGARDARKAEAEARAEGFPDRTVIYLDVEFPDTPSPDMREYVAAFAKYFADRAQEAGEGPRYRFGLYCGTAAVRYFVHALADAGVCGFPIWMIWWDNGQVVARADRLSPTGSQFWFEKRDWNWSTIEPLHVDRRSRAFAKYLDLHERHVKEQRALVARLDALVRDGKVDEAKAIANQKQALLAYEFDPAFAEHKERVEERWVEDEDAFDAMDRISTRDLDIVALQLPADGRFELSVRLRGLPVAKLPSGKLATLDWRDDSDIDIDVALCENPGLPPDP